MEDKERFKLIGGPYKAPRVKQGQILPCEIRGDLKVAAWTDAPIPWPLAKNPLGGGFMYIVYGDLARAIRTESNQAITYWFGASVATVTQWRRYLNVPRYNTGTKRLKSVWNYEMLSLEDRQRGAKRRIASPKRRRAFAPLPGGNNPQGQRHWTKEEIALLGTMSDAHAAKRIGCAIPTAGDKRRALGIPPYNQKIWKQQRVGRHTLVDPERLRARRLELNLPQTVIGERIGMTAYYGKIESGQPRHVKPQTLQKLAEALEITPDKLSVEPAPDTEAETVAE